MQWHQRAWIRLIIALVPLIGLQIAALAMDSISWTVRAIVVAAGTVAIYAGYVRWIERRPVIELGRDGAVRELALGAVLGAGLQAAVIGVLCALGMCEISTAGAFTGAAIMLGHAIAASVTEEIIVRAVLFRILERGLGSWLALAISAALFGGLHIMNANATWISSVAIALEAGVMLAAAFMVTRRLWLAFGLHAAWNFTEGGVFGAQVSGGTAHGILATRFHGPAIVTGGAFGPEASIVAVILCLAAAAVLLVIAQRRHRVVAPFWRSRNRDLR